MHASRSIPHPILGLTLALALAGCSAPALQLTPRLAQLDLEGELGISGATVNGQNDLENAGVEKDDSVPGARLDLDVGPVHWTVSTQSSTHDGDGTLDFDLTQGGVTISAGADVRTDVDLGVHQLALTWDLVPTDMLELGLGLGAAALDLDGSFQEIGTGTTVATDELAALPVLAARLGIDLGRLDLSVLASGLSIDYDGNDYRLVDLDFMARLQLFGGDARLAGFLVGGYRDVNAEVGYDDGSDRIEADVGLSGLYFGVSLGL
jgi:hypothetical protein